MQVYRTRAWPSHTDGATGGETDYTKRYVRFRNIRIKEVR
jgi:hypothetical protein